MALGRLIHGDNIAALQSIDAASVDLAYLDPPFATGRNFGAYDDRWPWTAEAERTMAKLSLSAIQIVKLVDIIPKPPPKAYLVHIAAQIEATRRVTRPAGTIVVHIDERFPHLVRLLAEVILAPAVWTDTVIWRYRRWATKARRFQRMHDVLMFFAPKGRTFHTLYGIERLAESTLKTFGRKKQRADFSQGKRKPGLDDFDSPGPPLSDVWEIGVIAPQGKERTGYPTQKPEALLERVIKAASNEGDTVLDPFCGSGTTPAVAERLHRKWIAIDRSPEAIGVVERRLAVRAEFVRSAA
jgi:site-specific DNA-methyltransferase (adenine-specific)